MLHFNSTDIEVGFIKQLLHTYNLPNIKVYNEDIPLIENQLYIKDTKIIQFKNGTEKFIRPFRLNTYIENITNTLPINSIDYDSHTHEYLGRYLRFLKDYQNCNLMSLYNCYSNNFPKLLQTKFSSDVGNLQSRDVVFNTKDSTYKIIMVPVRLGYTYTIAIDSMTGIEMFAGYYNNYYYNVLNLPNLTYEKVPVTHFKQPFVYDKLAVYKYDKLLKRSTSEKTELFKSPENALSKFAATDRELKLFIKIPFENNSAITILEGTYPDNSLDMNFKNSFLKSLPEVQVNFQKDIGSDKNGRFLRTGLTTSDIEMINFPAKLQLLEINCNISHPFADRLLEYLTENTISNINNIADNIKRIQMELYRNYHEGKTGKENFCSIIGDSVTQNTYIQKEEKSAEVGLESLPRYYGK